LPQKQRMPEKIDFAKIRFLICDPNALSLTMLGDILSMLGANYVRKVNDFEKAMNVLKEGNIDIIITEHDLPVEGGIKLVDYIRHDPASRDRMMPVIMLTARSEEQYVTEARDHGVNEFVAKPYTVDSLYKRLSMVIAYPRPYVSAPGYFGPDRRRKQMPFNGKERRGVDPNAKPS
jgi:two-component system, chemotaxis family, chemotaxis protein CheY